MVWGDGVSFSTTCMADLSGDLLKAGTRRRRTRLFSYGCVFSILRGKGSEISEDTRRICSTGNNRSGCGKRGSCAP